MENIDKYEKYYLAIIRSLQFNTSLFTIIAVLSKNNLPIAICTVSCIAFVTGLIVKPIVSFFYSKYQKLKQKMIEKKAAKKKQKIIKDAKRQTKASKKELTLDLESLKNKIEAVFDEDSIYSHNPETKEQIELLKSQIIDLEKLQNSIYKFAAFTDKKNLVTQVQDAHNEAERRIIENSQDIIITSVTNSTEITKTVIADIDAELNSNKIILSNLKELMKNIGKAATQRPETDEIANLGYNASVQALNKMYDTSNKAL